MAHSLLVYYTDTCTIYNKCTIMIISNTLYFIHDNDTFIHIISITLYFIHGNDTFIHIISIT